MENGMQMMLEQSIQKKIPNADCWCAGFPCQDISIAGKQLGFDGNRSSLYFRLIELLESKEKEDRPEWIFLENVKNLLSINQGWDFARVLFTLDEIGYDCQWQVLNSKNFGVPQNRERAFIIGHNRTKGRREIFPIIGTNEKNTIKQLGNYIPSATRINPSRGRIYSPHGLSPCLNSVQGGGAIPTFVDMNYTTEFNPTGNSRTLQVRYYKEICRRDAETSGIAIPVLTPNRTNKRQNGRRFKENGEPMFTLTAQDKHGIVVGNQNNFRIRRLTPKECFRLQGWPDEYFEKAALVNSESQLYRQAGNGVTVNVIKAIAKKMKEGK